MDTPSLSYNQLSAIQNAMTSLANLRGAGFRFDDIEFGVPEAPSTPGWVCVGTLVYGVGGRFSLRLDAR